MEPPYDFEKLAREIAVERLKEVKDTVAVAVAAEIVKKIAVAAVAGTASRQDPRTSVSAACRGVMNGMMLLERDLPATATAILQQMGAVASETNQDPMECMTWALEGMAEVCRLAPPTLQDAVRAAIDENFMGAGEVFVALLHQRGPET